MAIIVAIPSDVWICAFIIRSRLVDDQVLPRSGRKLEEIA
jgi:hypothetical protein